MSLPSDASIKTDAALWAQSEREQELHFKSLPLAEKWRAVTDAGELLRLIDQCAQVRLAKRKTHEHP